jgi:hypothetical protein
MPVTESSRSARAAIPMDLPRSRSVPDSRPHLPQLLAALEGGEEWSTAYPRYWQALTGGPVPDWPPTAGRLSWTWLTDLESIEHAIDLGSAFGEVASGLTAESSRVTYAGSGSLHREVVKERFRAPTSLVTITGEMPAGEASADVVAFVASEGWQSRLPAGVPSAGEIPSIAFRALRPGGWFACLCRSGVSFTALRAGPSGLASLVRDSLLRQALSTGIRRAGFAEVRRYALSPRPELPLAVVPIDGYALRAWSSLSGTGIGWWHRLPGRMRALPFAGTLLLAKR